MSVLITVKFPVSADVMEKTVAEHHDTMMSIIDEGRRHGCVHHAFVEDTDGTAMVVDEWPDEASFRRFFGGQDDIKTVMGAAGVTSEPVVAVHRVLDTADRF